MEERQLAAEMDQRRRFDKEKMNSRTRIKHMEKFFATPSPGSGGAEGEEGGRGGAGGGGAEDARPPVREFGAKEKAQLTQEYHHYETMDQLHAAKIKVLRDRQEKKLEDAIASSEQELNALIARHARDLDELRDEHRREEASLLRAAEAKRSSLCRRWYLEEAILRRKLELRHGLPYGPLPGISFSDAEAGRSVVEGGSS